ncbi:HAMP domain-containing sensor histidine kinase [Mangrovibrevibacter kandeliae]|uniref:HAMP domain-containing sensor histidine kinase n=1 Tax=Mangrovibrevibacter kandeliae TaxID=2968473 RepID=UPI002117B2E6|nr:HAMP domain-containing sensor histidine kinase [Aurantimonas sp. MSK8Z-1]MCQ8783604.1 HAMP domain-containing histidine kinase [Aurantimonas sp. CSK15Z-1]MCW4116435.1 HAMP domain-containing histidine kinase [Aurantimonas sp. MSK8Z-1]
MQQPSSPSDARPTLAFRLSIKLLWLTMLFVMLAEVLIFVPSVANFRQQWLREKIETAAVAGIAAENGGTDGLPVLRPEQEVGLLRALDARLVALQMGGASRLLAKSDDLGMVDSEFDLDAHGPVGMIAAAFDTLFEGGDRMLRILGGVGDGAMRAEVVIPEAGLRRAMLLYARNIFFLSLAVAGFAAGLVFVAISLLLIRPIRRMTRSMMRFAERPDDADRIITPSPRRDEIGLAEAELRDMQQRLARTLREQRHLADLGLAVSKINHDLRNILASAQLISDRFADVADPRVQRFAPTLLRSLDRAVAYTQSVLAYGRAVESAPVRRRLRLQMLVAEVFAEVCAGDEATIEQVNAVPENLEIEVDPEQFHRALANLMRNAVQALEGEGAGAVLRRITVEAERQADGGALVAIEDTGPGLPPRARENLFQAFRGSARAGGTGLGLAIAAEIVQAHGGSIRLAERAGPGARFEIELPPREGAAPRLSERAA